MGANGTGPLAQEAAGIPRFDAFEFAPKRGDYCVLIFVINEGYRLRGQLSRMKALSSEIDVCIADGGSTDGSTEQEALKKAGVNTLLVKNEEGRLGTQMRMAFAWALRRGYRGVVLIDGNGKDSVENIPDFVAKLREGYDYVQGSRFTRGGLSENLPLGRRLAIRLIHAPLISLASGYWFTDTTNGFRGYSSRFLSNPAIGVFRSVFRGYELHYYLAIAAVKGGFRVIEIPVARRYPKGKVPTKISPVHGNLEVLRCLLSAVLGRYSP